MKNNKINHRRHEDLTWKTLPMRKGKTTCTSQQIFTISSVFTTSNGGLQEEWSNEEQTLNSICRSGLKMATGMYPTGSSHPYPYPLGLNFTRWVTRTRTRVEKYFHSRTRWVICTRRVTHTRKHTRHSHKNLSHSKLHSHGYKSLIHHELKKDHTGYKFPNAINR